MNTSSSSATETPAQKPRMWMFAAWFAVVAIGMLIMVSVVVMTLGGGLNSQIAELEAAGEPTSMAQLKKGYDAIPVEQNAAIAIAALKGEISDVVMAANSIIDAPNFFEEPLSTKQAEEGAAILAEANGVVERVRTAIQRPQYAPSIELDTPENFVLDPSPRQTARLLYLQAKVLAAQGKHEEAADLALDIIRYGKHLENTPTITGYLVSLAVQRYGVMSLNESLQSGGIGKDAVVRQRLQAELADFDSSAGFVQAMRTERAFAIDQARNATGSLAMSMLLRPLIQQTNEAIEDVEKNGMSWPGAVTGASPPGMAPIQSVRSAVVRRDAQMGAIRLLEALTARNDPEADVETLALPEMVGRDPFSSGRLKVIQENNGWTIYSVGPDGVDQKGQGDDVALRNPPATAEMSE